MKLAILSVLGSVMMAGLVQARLGDPINPGQRAEVNGKMADLPLVEMNTVELPNQSQPKSSVTRRRLRSRTLPMNRVSPNTVATPIVETPVRATPLANFGPKRPVEFNERVATDTIRPTTLGQQRAPITDRVISATTPAGQEELVEQLRLRKR